MKIEWEMPTRTVKVDSQIAFIQEKDASSGTFMEPFTDISLD